MMTPEQVAAAHRTEDPSGYGISHDEQDGAVVALVLTRLRDGVVIGRFTDRTELDAAAEQDRTAG
jgi:hypothetical protein